MHILHVSVPGGGGALPYVDEERIGAMGICAGGSYTLAAAQTESRIRAVAGVCTWNVGAWIRDGISPQGQIRPDAGSP